MSSNDDNDASQHRLRYSDVADEPRRMLPPIQGFEKKPLVSIEEAVKPLVKLVLGIVEYASIAKQKCQLPPANGLSIDESASIRLYTMELKKNQSLYVVLNKTLRDEDRKLLENWFLYLKLLITSLSKMPSIPCRLFRGIKLDLSQDYPKGQKTVWWAFSSCTDSIEVLEKPCFMGKTGVRTLFIIDCYSGKDIRQHSHYSTENEVLLLPARRFQIEGCLDAGHDLHIIQLKEIKPEFPILDEVSDAHAPSSTSVDQVKLTSISMTALPPKIKQPQPMPPSPTIDLNYRNPDLERRIAEVQPCSNMNLDGQRLTDRDMEIVVKQAIIDKRCTKLSLQNTEMTSQGILTLVSGVGKSTTLEELNLSNNNLSDQDLFPLAQELSVIRTTTVKRYICRIPIAKELENTPIKTLILSDNNIGDEGAKYLANVLKVKGTLIQLHLNNNQIGDRGVQFLANALCDPATNLQKLYLHNNRLISNSSVGYLVNMLKQNRSLNTLWLIDCNLTNADRLILKEAVASKKNFHLIVEPFD